METKLIENPDAGFDKQILDFQTKYMEWSERDIAKYHEKYYSKPKAYVVAYEGDQMVGCINLLERSITFDGEDVLLAGIGGVCVHFDFRGRGIAKEMLRKGFEQFKIWNCDIAYLCTDPERLGKMYASVGFIALNRKYKFTGKSGKEYIHDGAMIAPVNSGAKFHKVLGSTTMLDLQGPDW